jgi:uncharacterized protein (AIM24 family)
VSDLRVEKRRAGAELTLSTGLKVRGSFFLAGSSATHFGPERIADLLNGEAGFFPFAVEGRGDTALYNRAQLVSVRLLESSGEARLDPGYELATERRVSMLLTNGESLCGAVRVYRPAGRDRLSDYARSSEVFRYVETASATFIVNSAHVIELRETA